MRGAWIGLGCALGIAASAAAGQAEEVQLVAGADTLFGTLVVPAASKPVPLVVMVSGSGPTDRDGNTPLLPGKNNSLRMLADSLRARGIATLRYDKRAVAESRRAAKAEQDLRVTTFSDDAAAWAKQYRNDPRFSKLVLLGHSEGALMATLAAKSGGVDGLVLVSGAGRPAKEILHEQLSQGAPPDLLKASDAIVDSLAAGQEVTNVPAALLALYRPSVQPYMMSWLPIDPAAELGRLRIPSLVVWGTSDIQVSRADADRLAASRKDVQKRIVNGMNHVLKRTAREGPKQIGSYSDSTLALAPGLVGPIVGFVQAAKRTP